MTISGALSEIFDVASDVLTMIQTNDLFMVYACAGILGIGIRVVKRLIGFY